MQSSLLGFHVAFFPLHRCIRDQMVTTKNFAAVNHENAAKEADRVADKCQIASHMNAG